MNYIVKDQDLVIQHWPGKGAWTYHLLIPNSRDILGTWGNIKVSGTLDDYAFQSKNLAPIKSRDKLLAVNAGIRKQLGKQAGDTVRVTMYLEAPNALNQEADVLACFEDAAVLAQFQAQSPGEQQAILQQILAQPDAASQEKKILAAIAMLAK